MNGCRWRSVFFCKIHKTRRSITEDNTKKDILPSLQINYIFEYCCCCLLSQPSIFLYTYIWILNLQEIVVIVVVIEVSKFSNVHTNYTFLSTQQINTFVHNYLYIDIWLLPLTRQAVLMVTVVSRDRRRPRRPGPRSPLSPPSVAAAVEACSPLRAPPPPWRRRRPPTPPPTQRRPPAAVVGPRRTWTVVLKIIFSLLNQY